MWHGNTVNFLLWGMYYGIIIVLEKHVFKNILDKLPGFVRHIYVVLIVLFGYIFFIGVDIIPFIKTIFSKNIIDTTTIFYMKENILLIIIGIILCFKMPDKLHDKINNNAIINVILPVVYLILFIITISFIVSGSFHPFLYNNF